MLLTHFVLRWASILSEDSDQGSRFSKTCAEDLICESVNMTIRAAFKESNNCTLDFKACAPLLLLN